MRQTVASISFLSCTFGCSRSFIQKYQLSIMSRNKITETHVDKQTPFTISKHDTGLKLLRRISWKTAKIFALIESEEIFFIFSWNHMVSQDIFISYELLLFCVDYLRMNENSCAKHGSVFQTMKICWWKYFDNQFSLRFLSWTCCVWSQSNCDPSACFFSPTGFLNLFSSEKTFSAFLSSFSIIAK